MIYPLIVFLSAFLLFQVQPLIAKAILPWFGGTAAVWTTCLLFFQTILLAGYAYAHFTTERLKPKTQGRLHAALLFASLLSLPILPREFLKPTGTEEPVTRILLLLLMTVGLPYFLLSTTGPLLQAWFAERAAREGRSRIYPYQLYALSNFGSLLALLSYPIVVEPRLTLRAQAWTWSFGYFLFVILCGVVSLNAKGETWHRDEVLADPSEERPGFAHYFHWTMLAFCASGLLLAVSTHMTQNIAAIPFLWVVPLSLYLLTFILCFGGKTWTWSRASSAFPLLALAMLAYGVSGAASNIEVKFLIPIFSIGFFVICMVCHGELARLKPSPRYLTGFYLTMSFGGALGGLFVGVISPLIFKGYTELPLLLILSALICLFSLYLDPEKGIRDPGWLACAGLMGYLVFFLAREAGSPPSRLHFIGRNFYGVLKVYDNDDPGQPDAARVLVHGTITHGEQFLDEKRSKLPTSYYSHDSGVGMAILAQQKRGAVRIGMIGLGTGTTAAYGRPGDLVKFYDINPMVPEIAKTQFHYIGDSKGQVEIALGDARLTLEREAPQDFDVLAVDAFSSDSIPVHLLTKEALALYFRNLKPDGILCVHISNRHLNLEPVIKLGADSLGVFAREVTATASEENDKTASDWILLTKDESRFKTGDLKDVGTVLTAKPQIRLWTDDYSNLYQIMRNVSGQSSSEE
ncbi:MAG: fused MFS/spermidine synthase [Chthonomonadaceae bacterium]|nr:fused MFS/spermidine synthase [Chthonomonadaceae bacterium]